MSARLDSPDWLTAPGTVAVLDALEAAGGAGCARFVGGCVRNAVLGAPVDDLDIATTLTPDAVIAALKAARIKAIPTGVEHGTVTAVRDRRPYEITTLRRDVETDGRRAVVAFTTDWGEDAARRDFTLNALYADRGGTIFDPVGGGFADARAGRIVFVGEAETRIREDYLRILRFFRFFAWYGRGEPDPVAVSACASLKGGMGALSAERISKELLKLLAAPDPRRAVAMMAETGVLAQILPEAASPARFDGLVSIETEILGDCDPLLRLAALLPADVAAVRAAAARLRLSNAQGGRLAAIAGAGPAIGAAMTPREMRRALYDLGAEAFADRAKLAWAARPDGDPASWRALLDGAAAWTRPVLPVTGDDAVAAGAPMGPRVGQALREVEAWWIGEDFPADRGAAVRRLEEIVAGSGAAGRR